MSTPVRVRFAPSPTGPTHVGSLRTALYNFLFARGRGGIFVLRIEDTDRARFVPGAMEQMIEALRWAGLTYDEGPAVGGPHGPYLQSQRLRLYREAAERLLASGHAYRCFCPPESLATRREALRAEGNPHKIEHACARLSAAETLAKLDAGMPHTVRLRVPEDEVIRISDLVRGEVRFDSNQIDDQVLLKSDGYPTYHLANVVDDHDMEITHVIRGEEWLSSTPKHVLLYRALGYNLPLFAHLPLLLNPDRSKLSKRQGDVAVEDYRAQGYLPEALVNFVAFLGWNPGGDREIFSLEELIGEFSLERVGKSGAIFNQEKLRWFNQEWLRRRPVDDILRELRPLLIARGWEAFSDEYVHKVILLMRDRLEFVRQYPDAAPWFFQDPESYDEEARNKRWTSKSSELLRRLLPELESTREPFTSSVLEEKVKGLAAREGVKAGEIIHPLRLACTGSGRGPGLYESLEVLGRETCLRRIRRACSVLG